MSDNRIPPRLRHFVILIPLGLGVGAITGYLFGDVVWGLLSGVVLGVVIAALFAVQAR